jgi:hypothetical protein
MICLDHYLSSTGFVNNYSKRWTDTFDVLIVVCQGVKDACTFHKQAYDPTDLICNNVFILNERLSATDHFKKVCQKVYWILRSLRPHASHTPKLGRGCLGNLLCLTLDMGVLCMLVRMLHGNGG